jgi:hypothetical protein
MSENAERFLRPASRSLSSNVVNPVWPAQVLPSARARNQQSSDQPRPIHLQALSS